MNIVRFIICTFLTSTCHSSISQIGNTRCSPLSFVVSKLDEEKAEQEYKTGVFRFECDGKPGTAFLIDYYSGICITAGHCVVENKPIIVTNGYLANGTDFEIFNYNNDKTIQKMAKELDVALIKPKSARDLKELQENCSILDISLIGREKNGYMLSLEENDHRRFTIRMTESTPDKGGYAFESKDIIYPGNSGSPLLNEHGLVYGICTNRKHFTSGTLVQLYYARDIISSIPLSPVISELDRNYRNESLEMNELYKYLEPGGQKKLSNVELLAWSDIADHYRKQYRKRSDLFRCFNLAKSGRMIAHLDDTESGYLSDKIDMGRIALNYSKYYDEQGSQEVSNYFIELSESYLVSGVVHYSRLKYNVDIWPSVEHSDVLKVENLMSDFGRGEGDAKGSMYFAGALNDLALVKYKMAKGATKSHKNELLEEAARYTIASIVTADTSGESSFGSLKIGRFYGQLGEILRSLDEKELAASAYSESAKLGFTPQWMETNYKSFSFTNDVPIEKYVIPRSSNSVLDSISNRVFQ